MNDVLLLFLGGVISVFSAILVYEYKERRKRRVRLVVRIGAEVIYPTPDPDDEWGALPPEDYFYLVISNNNPSREQITNVKFEVGKQSKPFPELDEYGLKLPIVIGPYDHTAYGVPMDEVIWWLQHMENISGKVSIKVSVRDVLDNWYKSNDMELTVRTPEKNRLPV